MIRRVFDQKWINKIVAYGMAWHKESVMRDLKFSRQRSAQVLRESFMSPDCAVFLALEEEKVRGVLIGAVCAYPFFDASYATDLAFCAHKEGAQLFRAFEQWAKNHGAQALQMGVTSALEGADDFYRAAGLIQTGGIYYKRL